MDRWYSEPYSRNHPSFPNILEALGGCPFLRDDPPGLRRWVFLLFHPWPPGKGSSPAPGGNPSGSGLHDPTPRWKGVISMWGASGRCTERIVRPRRVFPPLLSLPERCGNFTDGTPAWLSLGRSEGRGVKKVFVGSGSATILLANPELLEEILLHHSG